MWFIDVAVSVDRPVSPHTFLWSLKDILPTGPPLLQKLLNGILFMLISCGSPDKYNSFSITNIVIHLMRYMNCTCLKCIKSAPKMFQLKVCHGFITIHSSLYSEFVAAQTKSTKMRSTVFIIFLPKCALIIRNVYLDKNWQKAEKAWIIWFIHSLMFGSFL